jgi:transmembrane sensor
MQEESPQEKLFWSLASLKMAGEATPEELAELEELLRSHPEWGLRLQLFANIWNSGADKGAGTGPELDADAGVGMGVGAGVGRADAFNRHLQRLSNHLSVPVLQYEQAGWNEAMGRHGRAGRRRIFRIGLTAAACLLVVGSLVYFYTSIRHTGTGDGFNTVSTRPGSRSKIQLPDGTLVWLNADSRLAYRIGGTEPNREVQLTGEAYFDVARDKDHPFLIHTPSIDVRVLGTTFDVRSYGNEKKTEASLFKGSVEIVLHNDPDKKIILQPNEKLIVHNDEISVSGIKAAPAKADKADQPLITVGKVHFHQKDSSYVETLWMKNQLAFDNATLEEVAPQLERWYGVKVTLTDPGMKTLRFSAIFEDESLAQVMEALRLTGNFKYTIRKKEVIITP